MKTLGTLFLGIVLVPLCYGVFRSLWIFVMPFRDVPEGSFYLILGFLGYFAFQWAFFRPIRTYVFGHELTHAVAAMLSGARVRGFKFGKKGGYVKVTKSNWFVALAPYFVPIYSFILLGLYAAIHSFFPLNEYWNTFLGLLGISMGFHVALTLFALKQNQPDLKETQD